MNDTNWFAQNITHWPPDERRNLGIYILAYKGSGKSRYMGRVICLNDLFRHIPQVIIDGVGGLISNILDSVLRLPPPKRREVLSRLVYYDMSGKLTGHVCPLPLFYRLGSESWSDIGYRYLDTILTLDSNLSNAPILGANSIKQIGLPTNQILAASGWQITESRLLLEKTKLLKPRLKVLKAETDDLGLQEGCDFFLASYMGWDSKKRTLENGSYRRKIDLLLRDNRSIAIFGSSQIGLDLEQVETGGQTVLLDFSGDQQNQELMMFKMNWVFDYFNNYVKHRVETRGPGMHLPPIGLVIDEIAMLSQLDATSNSDQDMFATKIDELLNIWSRQGMVWVTLANQEKFQISPKLFKTLMGCGTIICGLTSDWEASVYLANEFLPPQPHRVKRYEAIYGPDETIREYRPVDMSLAEQTQLAAALFKNLGKFQFLVREVGRPQLWPLDITGLDPGLFPDDVHLREIKALLSEQHGTPVETILAEIKQRRREITDPDSKRKSTQLSVNSKAQSGKLEHTPNETPTDNEEHPDDDFYY